MVVKMVVKQRYQMCSVEAVREGDGGSRLTAKASERRARGTSMCFMALSL